LRSIPRKSIPQDLRTCKKQNDRSGAGKNPDVRQRRQSIAFRLLTQKQPSAKDRGLFFIFRYRYHF
jgi:hypothetical protein